MAVSRPIRIAVCGPGVAPDDLCELAGEVGERVARAGAVLICGGRGGVMEAVARGAAEAGGWTVGLLPGRDTDEANPFIRIPLATGMGEARNALVARAGEALIAIGGGWGTLAEIALARKLRIPVVLLRPTLGSALGLPTAESAEDAVRLALENARERRMERASRVPKRRP